MCYLASILLHRIWSTEDLNASQDIQHLKMNLVQSIDEKMWASIKTLQTTATWLDPTLKSFTFVENATDRRRSDAERMVLSQSSAAVEHLQRKLEDTIEIKEESAESPPSIKRSRLDPIGTVLQTQFLLELFKMRCLTFMKKYSATNASAEQKWKTMIH